MTARKARPAAAAGVGDAPWTRNCPDCVPELWIQGGDWGWRAHRYALHGEGEDPGPCPGATAPKREPKGWSDAEREDFHRRRRAAARRARYAPPPPRTPRPPRTGSSNGA